jgi:hypothetical protein
MRWWLTETLLRCNMSRCLASKPVLQRRPFSTSTIFSVGHFQRWPFSALAIFPKWQRWPTFQVGQIQTQNPLRFDVEAGFRIY